jgi:hypothetical protein
MDNLPTRSDVEALIEELQNRLSPEEFRERLRELVAHHLANSAQPDQQILRPDGSVFAVFEPSKTPVEMDS